MPTTTSTPLEIVRRSLADAANRASVIARVAESEGRPLWASEKRQILSIKDEVQELNARADLLTEQERRLDLDAQVRRETGTGDRTERTGPGGDSDGVYRRHGPHSYFRDLASAVRGDRAAAERLYSTRALGNTGAAGGSGGEFAPPGWLIEDWVRLARPGRITADLFSQAPLPMGVSSINLPKITTGTAIGPQSSQNTTLPVSDLTTGALTSGIVTLGGKQIVSQQLLDQSGIPLDQVILEDLAGAYAQQIGGQVLSGSGTAGQLKGLLAVTGGPVQTWTQAAPTAGGFFGQLAQLQGAIAATRFAAADTVIVHPRRWAWLASYTDSTGRPLVVPTDSGGAVNTVASSAGSVASGLVGRVLGMEVYSDPNVPTNLGAGANQDAVLVIRRDDIKFWESEVRAETFREPYADSLGVLFRLYTYSAMIPDRYPASVGRITGTGLVPPTFAG